MPYYKPLPTVERLRELFSYEPETGNLKWLIRRKGVNADMVAGAPSHGYIVVRVDGVLYLAHRIIWKLVTGQEPLDQIDHEDLNRSNNRWSNLRPADNSKNMMNAGLSRSNTSGFKGVFWDGYAQKWRAKVKLNQVTHDFGRFHCFGKAVRAMCSGRAQLHGEFARAN